MLRRHSALVGVTVAALLLAAFHLGLLRSLERRFYDFQFSLRGEVPPHPALVIVAIDDHSVDAVGPWPWPRQVHAQFLHLVAPQARAVAFDLLFLEQSKDPAADAAFAQATEQAGNVFLAMFLTREGQLSIGPYGVRMKGMRLPYSALARAAAGVGPVNVFPDRDGVIRAAPLVLDCGGVPFPSMSACLANYLLGRRGQQGDIRLGRWLRLGTYQVPVDEAGEMLVNYPGGYGCYPTVSYSEVLSGAVPPSYFRGKVVLVGFTATGLSDLKPTPLCPACPGVEVNAAILDTLLKPSFLMRPAAGLETLVILLATLAPALLLPLVPRGRGLLLVAALAVGWVGLGVLAFQHWGYWLAQGTPLVGLAASTAAFLVLQARQQEHDTIRMSANVSALALATRMIAASTSIETLLPAIREEIRAVMQATHTLVFLPHPERESLVLSGARQYVEILPGEGLIGKVAAGSPPVLLGPEEEGLAELPAVTDRPVSSAMIAPLRAGEKLQGVVLVADRLDGKPYAPEDLELLGTLGYEAAVALENAELYGKLAGRIELADRELRQAYSQLNVEKERVEALLENMSDAVYMTDTGGSIIFLNPAAQALFGVSAERGVGASAAQVTGLPALGELAQAALSGERPLATTQVELAEPVRRVLSATAARVRGEEGKPIGVVTVLSDVTLLQELSDMKTEFVSLVSHELRTPLTSIQGFTQTLQQDTQGHFDEETRQEFLGIIYGECRRLITMINELLDSSRLEAGRPLPMNWAQVSLPELVERAVTLQRSGAEQHTFEVDFPADFPEITADQDRVEQVLVNLLSNAIKYSPSGGLVRITGSAGEGEVELAIADQGLGMTPEQMGQLFQRYHRVEEEATKRIRGTGLGLYLTKGLVEAHRGRIWAESEGPGKGSTFHLALPISQPEQAQ